MRSRRFSFADFRLNDAPRVMNATGVMTPDMPATTVSSVSGRSMCSALTTMPSMAPQMSLFFAMPRRMLATFSFVLPAPALPLAIAAFCPQISSTTTENTL